MSNDIAQPTEQNYIRSTSINGGGKAAKPPALDTSACKSLRSIPPECAYLNGLRQWKDKFGDTKDKANPKSRHQHTSSS
jgi:hypothetical protein